MPWVKLTDDWYDDLKFTDAHPLAIHLWVVALTWSARNLQDGKVPEGVVRRLIDWSVTDVTPSAMAAELVSVGAWTLDEPTGYIIVNYLKYQPSREDVLAKREAERDRKARGGSSQGHRGSVDHDTTSSNGSSQGQSGPIDHDPSRSDGVPPGIPPDVTTVPTTPVPVPGPEPLLSAEPTTKAGRRKPKTDAPTEFVVTEALRAWLDKQGFSRFDVTAETQMFLDHHRAKGNQHSDWNAAWRNWMTRAEDYAIQRGVRPRVDAREEAPWLS